jgi:hypothetical protein
MAEGELLAVPEPRHPALCVLVLRLPECPLAVTALNFGREGVEEALDLRGLAGVPPEAVRGGRWADALSGDRVGPPAEAGRLPVRLRALSGTTFVLDTKGR